MKWSISDKIIQRVIIPVVAIVAILLVIIVVSTVGKKEESPASQVTTESTPVESTVTVPVSNRGLLEYYDDRYDMQVEVLTLFQESSSGGVNPYSLERPIFYKDSLERATIEELFYGPSAEEVLEKNIFSLLPTPQTLEVRVEYPVLYVDVAFAETPSEVLLPAVLYQILVTGLQFDYINAVSLRINGVTPSFSYENVVYNTPFSPLVVSKLEEFLF